MKENRRRESKLRKKTKGEEEARREPRSLASGFAAPLDKEAAPRAGLGAVPGQGRTAP